MSVILDLIKSDGERIGSVTHPATDSNEVRIILSVAKDLTKATAVLHPIRKEGLAYLQKAEMENFFGFTTSFPGGFFVVMAERIQGHRPQIQQIDLTGARIDAGARFKSPAISSGGSFDGARAVEVSPVALRTTQLRINGGEVMWRETADFPTTDPWSVQLRNVLAGLRSQGAFIGRNLFEAGLGDGRNMAVAVGHASHDTIGSIIGIERDTPRVSVGRDNLIALGLPQDRLAVHESDAVDFVTGISGSDHLTGWGIACLPQAPEKETKNLADGVKSSPSHEVARSLDIGGFSVNDYGLSLNAAFLLELRRKVVDGDFQLLLTLSGRIPKQVREELMKKTGWLIVEEHRTEQPIVQDKDTGVKYVEKYASEFVPDDGDGFFEKRDEEFFDIPADEAERRREAHMAAPHAEPLNVYHNVSVYQLRPVPDLIEEFRGAPVAQLYDRVLVDA